MKKELIFNVYHRSSSNKIELVNILDYDFIREELVELRKEYKKGYKKFNETWFYAYNKNGMNVEFNPETCMKAGGFNNKFKDEVFAKRLETVLRYYFWSRCECEIVLTDWPTSITHKELEKLVSEPVTYRHSVELDISKKIDMFEQVQNNWNIFIDYVWSNLNDADLTLKYTRYDKVNN